MKRRRRKAVMGNWWDSAEAVERALILKCLLLDTWRAVLSEDDIERAECEIDSLHTRAKELDR